ncbi:MAG: virulence factor [Alkalilacustris sp.]
MPDLTILSWRDIPAQVLVGRGRETVRVVLPDRFAEAIDRAAMVAGAVGSEAYLADWRRSPPHPVDGPPRAAAETAAAALAAAHDDARLRALIAAGGWAGTDPAPV